MLRASIIGCCAVLCACDRRTPAPPSVDPPGPVETIGGSERIGWDQRAASAAELGAIRYALYIDNTRTELSNATCTATAQGGAFPCAANLPALAPGMHTLQLAAFIIDGSVFESSRSTALRVNVVATSTTAAGRPLSDRRSSEAAHSAPRTDGRVDFGSGVVYRLDVIGDDVEDPSDMAVAPDGRVFVAERGGRIRIVPGGAETLASEAQLLAIALDPDFERTHFVYAIYTAPSAPGDRTFVLARFREVSNTFGDRAILADNIRAAGAAAAALRFGPDGALYAAFDDGGEEAAANDPASPQGKVLRMNADGSTPPDQAGGNPLFAAGFRSPRGLAWHAGSALLWVAERRGTLTAVDLESDSVGRNKRGATRRQYAVPESLNPSSIAFAGDDLLVAAGPRRGLLRIRFDPRNPLTITGTDRLLEDRVGPIYVVATDPHGAIYVGTDHSVVRLVPLQQ